MAQYEVALDVSARTVNFIVIDRIKINYLCGLARKVYTEQMTLLSFELTI